MSDGHRPAPGVGAAVSATEPRFVNGGSTALVLTGGGARAAYQVGVLAGIAEKAGDAAFDIVTGVSAGSLNATYLAGARGPLKRSAAMLEKMWMTMSVDHVFRAGPQSIVWSAIKTAWLMAVGGQSPNLVRGVLDTQPLRESLGRVIDTDGIDRNLRSGRLRAAALSATSYATGRTVTFVHALDNVRMWRRAGRVALRARLDVDHVMASCALPLLFPAIPIGDAWFGDGSVRQGAPLAPAIHLGADRLLAVGVRRQRSAGDSVEYESGYPPPAQIFGMLFNAVFTDALEADAERIERVNRTLSIFPEGVEHPDRLRPIRQFVLRPSRDLSQLSADLIGSLPQALRALIRGMGIKQVKSPDLLSYLLFERPYIERLIELGRGDARDHWDSIAPILDR